MKAVRFGKLSGKPGGVPLQVLGLILGAVLAVASTAQAEPLVVKLTLHDTVQPISAGYLQRGLDAAAERHAALVIVSLDTPGGLLDSTRAMVAAIERSPVPVAVYVSPAGARAGGFSLLEAADVAAMVPGTNAGAAHSIVAGRAVGPILKIENDAALLAALDGRAIRRFDGTAVTLRLRDPRIVKMAPSLRERILSSLTNPDLAVLLLLAGVLLIYLEFNVPGTIVAGSLGVLLTLLAVFGLSLLPIHPASIFLLVTGLVVVLLEVKIPSRGALWLAGVVALVFGLATLVDGPIEEMRVDRSVAVAVGVAFGAISYLLAAIAMRARRNKFALGPEAMVGRVAKAITALAPTGQVEVRGELWRAVLGEGGSVGAGAAVRVRGIDGLTLVVVSQPVVVEAV